MSSSPATMAASRIMSYSKGSLRNLIRSHLRPTAGANSTAADAAAFQLVNSAPGSVRRCAAQDFAASEMRSLKYRSAGVAPIQFRIGLAAEHFVDQSRIELRGRVIKNDDDDSNYDDDEAIDDDDDDDDDEDFDVPDDVPDKDYHKHLLRPDRNSDDDSDDDDGDFRRYRK